MKSGLTKSGLTPPVAKHSSIFQPSAKKTRERRHPGMLALAIVLGLALAPASVHGQTFTLLHTFTGYPDGANPNASLIRDSAGNLYGTTESGGAFNWGTVFELE
jgi:hypothetical protein